MEDLKEKSKKCLESRNFFKQKCNENKILFKKYNCEFLINYHYPSLLDEFDKKEHFNNLSILDKDFDFSTEAAISKKQKAFYTGNREIDFQKVYDMCVAKIKKYNIEIINVDKNFDKFTGGNGYCELYVFIFYCKKGNFEFKINFADTCDCFPGILDTEFVTEISSGKKIKAICDFFHQNRRKIELVNFITLINSKNFEDFINIRYKHLLELPILHKYGFIGKCVNVEVKKSTINDYKINFYFKVSNNKGSCLIVPYGGYGNNDKKYILNLCHTLKEYNVKNKKKYKNDYFEYKNITNSMFSKSFEVEYNSIDDIEILVECINKFIDYKNKEYGYLEEGKYRNDHEIRKWVNNFVKNYKKDDIHLDLQIYHKSYKYMGPVFDVFIHFIPEYTIPTIPTIFALNKFKDISYLCDVYGIHFYYDPKIDSDNCILNIQCKCFNFTEFFNKKLDPADDKWVIINCQEYINKDIISFSFKGTYSECFKIITEFLILLNE